MKKSKLALGVCGFLLFAVALTFQNCSGFKAATKPFNFSSVASFRNNFGASNGPKYGMFYLTLNCLSGSANHDISKFIAGESGLGPVPEFHWWTEPREGYYCIVRDRQVLRNHAIMLRDMGIDFIYFDNTNFTDASNPQASYATVEGLKAIMEEWSKIPGAPRVVVWQPLSAGATMPHAVESILSQYPQMLFNFQGKPLMFVVENEFYSVDPGLWAQFEQKYTLRKMWGVYGPGRGGSNWSFMEHCQADFKASNGTGPCNQRVAVGASGAVEQISVTTAYQSNWMSNISQAVPQFEGRTFLAQMQALDAHPEAQIVTITGWNEWVAMRFCLRGLAPVPDCGADTTDRINGNPVFTDTWDKDYNRDIEPSKRYGDHMYQVVKQEILRRKTKVIGYVDAVEALANGTAAVHGWACVTGSNQQIDVHVYLGGAAGDGGQPAAAAFAGNASEPAVVENCGDGQGHRFTAILDAPTVGGSFGKLIYVHGIGGSSNPTIANSGVLTVPAQITTQLASSGGGGNVNTSQVPSGGATSDRVPASLTRSVWPEGFVQVPGNPAVFYSNGNDAFCVYTNWLDFTRAGGSAAKIQPVAATSVPVRYDGACVVPPEPSGFFRVNNSADIFYSNGVNAFCRVPSWDKFLKSGGAPDGSNVRSDRTAVPQSMANHGDCQ